jgi:hypothetical protein
MQITELDGGPALAQPFPRQLSGMSTLRFVGDLEYGKRRRPDILARAW